MCLIIYSLNLAPLHTNREPVIAEYSYSRLVFEAMTAILADQLDILSQYYSAPENLANALIEMFSHTDYPN